MPSHKIHLEIIKRVNDKLNLDLDSVMLGSVLPDLTISKNHDCNDTFYQTTYQFFLFLT